METIPRTPSPASELILIPSQSNKRSNSGTVDRKNISRRKYLTQDFENASLEEEFRYLNPPTHDPKVEYIANAEFYNRLHRYYSCPLPPVNQVFPWLHGLSLRNKQQLEFFSKSPQSHHPPKLQEKPIVVIRSCHVKREGVSRCSGQIKGSVEPNEILVALDKTRGREENVEALESLLTAVSSVMAVDAKYKAKLIKDIYKCERLPLFNDCDPPIGVSSRNFDLQTSKWAMLSDVIVYCFNDDHQLVCEDRKDCCCESLARLIVLAQLRMCIDHDTSHFKTSILLQPDLAGLTKRNLLASAIAGSKDQENHHPNLQEVTDWNSNYYYKEKLEILKMSAATPVTSDLWFGNVSDFNSSKSDKIAFINNRNYYDADNTVVTLTKSSNESLVHSARCDWKIFISCHEGAEFPEVPATSDKNVLLHFPSSGSLRLGDVSLAHLKKLLKLCQWLYRKVYLEHVPALIFCADGYTELSLLGGCFLIYSQGIPLDNALLRLHTEQKRPFFLFKNDYQLLEKLAPLLIEFSPASDPQSASSNFNHAESKIISVLLRRELKTDTLPLECLKHSFGSLPSRILQYLYLGSLVHANNFELIEALGITRIVSVGEDIEWVEALGYTVKASEPNYEILKVCCPDMTIEIMRINNLNDDGIGSINGTLHSALDFIGKCYKDDAKVLVHCQVGVSRSATVCIAEVARRLNVSIARAYLFVRARRLNVIIQPNLRLMYELFKWEEQVNSVGTVEYAVSSDSEDSYTWGETHMTSLNSNFAAGKQNLVSLEEAVVSDVEDMLDKQEDYSDGYQREVDWCILCREIHNLNKNYTNN